MKAVVLTGGVGGAKFVLGLEYFFGGQPAVDRATSGWGLPSLASLWDKLPSDFPFQVDAAVTAKAEGDAVQTLPDSPYMDAAVFVAELDSAVMSVANGNATTDEALATLQSNLNDTLAQGKDQLG